MAPQSMVLLRTSDPNISGRCLHNLFKFATKDCLMIHIPLLSLQWSDQQPVFVLAPWFSTVPPEISGNRYVSPRTVRAFYSVVFFL